MAVSSLTSDLFCSPTHTKKKHTRALDDKKPRHGKKNNSNDVTTRQPPRDRLNGRFEWRLRLSDAERSNYLRLEALAAVSSTPLLYYKDTPSPASERRLARPSVRTRDCVVNRQFLTPTLPKLHNTIFIGKNNSAREPFAILFELSKQTRNNSSSTSTRDNLSRTYSITRKTLQSKRKKKTVTPSEKSSRTSFGFGYFRPVSIGSGADRRTAAEWSRACSRTYTVLSYI